MTVIKLTRNTVEKVWGRVDLPPMFDGLQAGGRRIGEIWFEHPGGRDVPLLVKFLFTSEKLSIQVHPRDQAAREAGAARGKDEAWIVLRADPGAVIGIGLTHHVSPEQLEAAALDGSIEDLVHWRPAAAGDIYYSPAGTIHALGPGLVLVEVQQNCDITYRLFDYGRPRELHIDQAIEASNPALSAQLSRPRQLGAGRELIAEGDAFVIERWRGVHDTLQPIAEAPIWVIPIAGEGRLGSELLLPGEAWLVSGAATLRLNEGAELLLAYPIQTSAAPAPSTL